MKYLIMTDLEGVAGVDLFTQTRTTDVNMKYEAMKQLARETNACMDGIRDVDPQAQVVVIDGHGTGGLFPEDIEKGRYVSYEDFLKETVEHYAGLYFVGQHAMAGTYNAPLCHTYSSLTVQYYRINGVNIGEFAGIAAWAGILYHIPTVFLAGDDKTALEARIFVPDIEVAVTKLGKGVEAAEHLGSAEACALIRERAAKATQRVAEIPPFTGFQAPYVFEARHYEPLHREDWAGKPRVEFVDDRTYRITTMDLRDLPII